MNETLHLIILSPEKTLFEGEVLSVTLPGEMGRFTVLPMHAPLISSIEKGSVSYVPKENAFPVSFQIQSGFAEVKSNRVTVCIEL